MLDPEFKTKWVAALESGEYPQARQQLYNPGVGYCCLGVACVVAGAAFKDNCEGELRAVLNGKIISDENTSLAGNFMQEIGLTDMEQTELYRMNDGFLPEDDDKHIPCHSFKKIAAYIKENL